MFNNDPHWPPPLMPSRKYVFMPEDIGDIDLVLRTKAPGTIFVEERTFEEKPVDTQYPIYQSLTDIDYGKNGLGIVALLGMNTWRPNWAFNDSSSEWYDRTALDWFPAMMFRLPDPPWLIDMTDDHPAYEAKFAQPFWFRCRRDVREDAMLARRIMGALGKFSSQSGFRLARPPDFAPTDELDNTVRVSERARAWSADKSNRLLHPFGSADDPIMGLRPFLEPEC